ncbi:DNA topoisomerase IV, alpha subunit [Xylariaceae sp. FL0804]|nr:DNA topoisomerase IV, alpha subunit [Xylariaceae sp. FL0804]
MAHSPALDEDRAELCRTGNVVSFPRGLARNTHAASAITKIEAVLEAIIDAVGERRVLEMPIRNRQSGNVRVVRFPASTDTEAKRFTSFLLVLHLSHQALVDGSVITKRNIYYQNPDLFGSQQYVDKLVDDIAFTFSLGRDALNIVAACQGLIAGRVNIVTSDGSIQDCGLSEDGTLIPNIRSIHQIDSGATKWILVIEKEATFRGLATSRYFETSAAGPGMLVTAKGYPDLATRQFLYFVHRAFPEIPMFALVDFDPHGISILRTYKHGSRRLSHEENVTLSALAWIGPRVKDVIGTFPSLPPESALLAPHTAEVSSSQRDARGRIRSAGPAESAAALKASDRKLTVALLRKIMADSSHSSEDTELVFELQIMLMLNVKAEIQALDEAGDMIAWLDERLAEGLGQR